MSKRSHGSKLFLAALSLIGTADAVISEYNKLVFGRDARTHNTESYFIYIVNKNTSIYTSKPGLSLTKILYENEFDGRKNHYEKNLTFLSIFYDGISLECTVPYLGRYRFQAI